MRRSILSNAARPLRSATSALAHQQPRRMFASPAAHPAGEQPEQVHPIGAFYESILNSQLYADKKPEVPPKSAAPSAQPDTPATPDAPKPAPAATPKPASNSRAATEEAAPAAQAAPTKPRRNGRKPKDADSKAKPEPASSSGPA
ncbi:hypothetical protein B0T17DRAFT_538636 [Bombardia bombarda]|uniref:Uncharacterized protein n=1 Tax=Bombardia bombarda TaxID=252184 RepID=A0AA39WHR3_9PEZI|nr:hypothetical protein B0T17DRAFT_538636 [Bombardia bombarda]